MSTSRHGSGVRLIENLSRDWPRFFPKGVQVPEGVAALEFLLPLGMSDSEWGRPASGGLEYAISGILECAIGWTVYELSLNVETYSRVRHRRGYWATQERVSTQVPVAEASSRDGDMLYSGGVARVDFSSSGLASSLTRYSDSWRVLLLTPAHCDPSGVLEGILTSPHIGRLDFWVRYALPEVVSLVLREDGVVIRLWSQDSNELEVIGSRRLIVRWAARLDRTH